MGEETDISIKEVMFERVHSYVKRTLFPFVRIGIFWEDKPLAYGFVAMWKADSHSSIGFDERGHKTMQTLGYNMASILQK